MDDRIQNKSHDLPMVHHLGYTGRIAKDAHRTCSELFSVSALLTPFKFQSTSFIPMAAFPLLGRARHICAFGVHREFVMVSSTSYSAWPGDMPHTRDIPWPPEVCL